MIDFEEVKKFLPYYLCDASQDKLFKEIKAFPDNIDDRIYSQVLTKNEIIYQGDGINGLLVVDLPSREFKPTPSMVISNTCDIFSENKRYISPRIIYAPILNLEKYKQRVLGEYKKEDSKKIDEHVNAIRKQFNTQIFYLPKGAGLGSESIVFLDRLNNSPSDSLSAEEIKENKIFALSDYGFYLFLVKLSIHFTRVREDIERTSLKQHYL